MPSKIKVLQVIPKLGYGGAETGCYDLAHYLYEKDFEDLRKKTNIEKIFDIISNFSEISEIRYVGGSIRKIINNEKVDDIDLATNIIPEKVCEILKNYNFKKRCFNRRETC